MTRPIYTGVFMPLFLALATFVGCSSLATVKDAVTKTHDKTSNFGDGNGFDSGSATLCSASKFGEPEDPPVTNDLLPVQANWMIAGSQPLHLTIECLVLPSFRIRATQATPVPITELTISLQSYDGGDWVQALGRELVVSSDTETLGTHQSTTVGPSISWEIDLTEYNLVVTPNRDLSLEFHLPGFENTLSIDEFSDAEPDQLFIMVQAGHSQLTQTPNGSSVYSAYTTGASLSLWIDAATP